jgi:cellulose biosynthesis protein BcsQ
MFYSVIFKGLTDADIQTIGKRFNPPVLAKIGAKLDSQETREAINSLTAINNEVLLIDLDSVDESMLIDSLHIYRVQRPETRIIIYAVGRRPGDVALAKLRGMSVHDLLAPDETPANMAEYIIQALESLPADYASSARFGISQKSQVAPRKSMPGIGINIKLGWPERKVANQDVHVQYMPHVLAAVWSPGGFAKAFTAFNLAALAASKGFDVALVNYDLQYPELDTWFGVKQTGLADFKQESAGVMSFAEDFDPELVSSFLRKCAWGIQYLPAGNKLGRLGTPEIEKEKLEQVLRNIWNRPLVGNRPAITIVDAGGCWRDAWTLVALRQAGVVLIPSDGSRAMAEVTKQQIEELNRLGGCCSRFIEMFLDAGKRGHGICRERIAVKFDYAEYVTSTKPAALNREDWEAVLQRLAPGSQEMEAQSFDDED